MDNTNQGELLDYLRGLPRIWITAKELHSIIKKDVDISYVCVNRKLERLWKWHLVERVKDKNERHGYRYRLLENG